MIRQPQRRAPSSALSSTSSSPAVVADGAASLSPVAAAVAVSHDGPVWRIGVPSPPRMLQNYTYGRTFMHPGFLFSPRSFRCHFWKYTLTEGCLSIEMGEHVVQY